jgi:antitoxin (DNA-binding transcriptional repressor) of toxin-antitoxin stability system
MRRISMTEWRKNFERYVEETSSGAAFVITRYGKPHCRLEPLGPADQAEFERAGLKSGDRS